MSPSQEILHSIENRLRELEGEIAALEAARVELQASAPAPAPARKPPGRSGAKTGTAKGRGQKPGARADRAAEVSEEAWLERRAAELAAQSREARAA